MSRPETPDWIDVPAGSFWMGGGEKANENPRHRVAVSAFRLARTPVTRGEYRLFLDATGHAPPPFWDEPAFADPRMPAVGPSWDDAVGYCEWLGGRTGETIRLPTEAEWEMACRGGSTARYPWGDDGAGHDAYAWLAENAGGRCHEAKSKKANGAGLYGMIGNTWEWTSSLYVPYPVRLGDGRDDLAARGARTLRGGSFRTPVSEIGSATRRSAEEGLVADDVGFRIVREFSGAASRHR